MFVWIFNVGRGFASFIRLPQNIGILCDMGRSDEFSPRDFIFKNIVPKLDKYSADGKERLLAQLILSHPHLDHINEVEPRVGEEEDTSGFPDAHLWTCPHDNDLRREDATRYQDEKVDFQRITNPGDAKTKVESYRTAYRDRRPPLQSIPRGNYCEGGLEYGIFYVRPPECARIHDGNDQDYSNAISLVVYFRYQQNSILIPGDVTPEALAYILSGDAKVERRWTSFDPSTQDSVLKAEGQKQVGLGECLRNSGLTILVAPHHGLESGYRDDLYDYCRDGKPDLVLVSEKSHTSETDGKVHPRYQSENGANGLSVNVGGNAETRRSVSTREGHILVVFPCGGKPRVYVRSDPEALLDVFFR